MEKEHSFKKRYVVIESVLLMSPANHGLVYTSMSTSSSNGECKKMQRKKCGVISTTVSAREKSSTRRAEWLFLVSYAPKRNYSGIANATAIQLQLKKSSKPVRARLAYVCAMKITKQQIPVRKSL
jgi:hypothetical protein